MKFILINSRRLSLLSLAIFAAFFAQSPAAVAFDVNSSCTPYMGVCPDGSQPELLGTADAGTYACSGVQCAAPVVNFAATTSNSSGPATAAECGCSSDYVPVKMMDSYYVCQKYNFTATVACGAAFATTSASSATSATTTKSVTSALNTSSTNAATVIESTAASSSGLQSTALKAAGDTMLTGANNRATVALIGCAAGANEELDSAGSGTGNVADCQDNFAKADELAKMAGKTGKNAILSPDSSVINSEVGQDTLQRFTKNFGVSQEDYVSRMLASHGARAEFEDMLKAKFSDDHVGKLMAAAAETAPSEEKASVAASDVTGPTKKKIDTTLRDSIKAKLGSGRDLASLKKYKVNDDNSGRTFKATNLQPSLALDGVMYGSQDQESEMTLFQVVTQKIREFTARQKL